jgi:hypothetical protein
MSIQPKDLRYTITTDYGVTVLAHATKSWEEGQVQWMRSLKYWGMFRSFSIPMQFALDGRDVLAGIFAEQGAQGNAEVLIERLNRGAWSEYKTYYNAKCDFTQAKLSDSYFDVNLVEGGLSYQIKSKENVVYDLLESPAFSYLQLENVRINVNPVDPDKFVEMATIRSAFEAILVSMTGTEQRVVSDFLDGLQSDALIIFISSGILMRCGSGTGVKMNVSFEDLFNILNSRFCIGIGIEEDIDGEYLRIERREYFLADTPISDIVVNGRNIQITAAKELMGNEFSMGWQTWTPQGQNEDPIKDRFNREVVAVLPTNVLKTSIDIRSNCYADFDYIKHMAYYGGVITEDVAGDTDMFVCDVRFDDPDYIANNGTCNGTYTGNLYMSPKQSLLDWIPFIESICFKVLGQPEVTFVYPDGNGEYTMYSGWFGPTNWEESLPVPLPGASYLFKPYIFEVEFYGDVDLADIVDADHNGYFPFTYNGQTLKGHIMEISVNPSRRKQLKAKLLAHKDTDLTLLYPNPVIPI